MATENYRAKWEQVTAGDVDAQTKAFLQAFVLDFKGDFEAVLEIAEQW